jgi:hypothetical protein
MRWLPFVQRSANLLPVKEVERDDALLDVEFDQVFGLCPLCGVASLCDLLSRANWLFHLSDA